jgi:hypothetical protein
VLTCTDNCLPHACRLLGKDHASLQGFVARDMKVLDRTDRPCHQLLFSDGAEVAFYVDFHAKASKSKAHIYLRSPKVYIVPEAVILDAVDTDVIDGVMFQASPKKGHYALRTPKSTPKSG